MHVFLIRWEAVGSDLLDNDNQTGITLERSGIHGESPYISIDLGENPCEIVNVQVSGWNPQKMGFFKVNYLVSSSKIYVNIPKC